MRSFTFGDLDSKDYNIGISGSGIYTIPARDVEKITIPGRNGQLTIDKGRYENVEVKYPAYIADGFQQSYDQFRAKITQMKGYQKLRDDYSPEYYRYGLFESELSPSVGVLNRNAVFDIVFNCKPQRFLISGDEVVEFTADGQIFNPTNQNAKPLIRIYGTGVVTINGYQMSILGHNQSYVDIDTEIYDAYCNGTNMNRYVAINEFVGFPILKSGNNVVDLGSGITKVQITPRWFEI